jgi:DNA-binding MarR family transcriptional regulator
MNRPLIPRPGGAGPEDGPPEARASASPLAEFHSIPGHLFRRCRNRSTAMFVEACRPHDITPDQYAVLKVVQIHPDSDQSETGAHAALDASTVGQVIARLRERGYLATRRDGKRSLTALTAEGRALIETLDPLVATAQRRTLGPLTKREQQQLLRLMSKLIGVSTAYHRPARERRRP